MCSGRIILLILSLSISSSASAQLLDKVLDVFEFSLNEKAVAKDSSIYPSTLVLAPIISYAPETSWGFGVGAKYLFKFKGSGEETRTSNMPMSAMYTWYRQILLTSGYTIFTNQEKYLFKGNLRYNKLPIFYFGIGNNSLEENEELYDYSNILIEPLALRKIADHVFVGGGVRYNIVYHVDIPSDGFIAREKVPGYLGSTSAGLQLALTYDNRDNVLYATKGALLEVAAGYYLPFAGGEYEYQIYRFDYRQYFKVFENRKDVFALQLLGYFARGDVPLADYAKLGGSEMLRGYYEGRFRDKAMLAAQVEYRAQLLEQLGAVVFLGLGDVAPNIRSFDIREFKPSVGAGLRFMIVKKENLNIRFDYGFGRETRNYYFNIAEAF